MTLTYDTFAALRDQPFQLYLDPWDAAPAERAAPIAITLIQAEAHGPGTVGQRQTFTLTFCAMGGPQLAQQTYMVAHPQLGEHPIFLVPIGPGRGGMLYEAIFN